MIACAAAGIASRVGKCTSLETSQSAAVVLAFINVQPFAEWGGFLGAR